MNPLVASQPPPPPHVRVLIHLLATIWAFPKNRDTPKWMVYNGKPYFLRDDLGGKPTIFGKHPYASNLEKPSSNYHLVIQSNLFGMVKWPFQGVKWPPTRGWKGHFESLGKLFFIRHLHLRDSSGVIPMARWRWEFGVPFLPSKGMFCDENQWGVLGWIVFHQNVFRFPPNVLFFSGGQFFGLRWWWFFLFHPWKKLLGEVLKKRGFFGSVLKLGDVSGRDSSVKLACWAHQIWFNVNLFWMSDCCADLVRLPQIDMI